VAAGESAGSAKGEKKRGERNLLVGKEGTRRLLREGGVLPSSFQRGRGEKKNEPFREEKEESLGVRLLHYFGEREKGGFPHLLKERGKGAGGEMSARALCPRHRKEKPSFHEGKQSLGAFGKKTAKETARILRSKGGEGFNMRRGEKGRATLSAVSHKRKENGATLLKRRRRKAPLPCTVKSNGEGWHSSKKGRALRREKRRRRRNVLQTLIGGSHQREGKKFAIIHAEKGGGKRTYGWGGRRKACGGVCGGGRGETEKRVEGGRGKKEK